MFSALRRPSAPDTVPIDIELFAPTSTRRVTPKTIEPPQVARIAPTSLRFRVSRKRFKLEPLEVVAGRLRLKPPVAVEWLLAPVPPSELPVPVTTQQIDLAVLTTRSRRLAVRSELPVPVTSQQIDLAVLRTRSRRLTVRPAVGVESPPIEVPTTLTTSVETQPDPLVSASIGVALTTSTVSRNAPEDPQVEVVRYKQGLLKIPASLVKSIPMVIKRPRTNGAVYYHFESTPIDRAAKVSQGEATKPRFVDANSIEALFYILLAKWNWDARIADLDALLAAYPPGKTPYPFQFEGIKFLFDRNRALLSDEMGLGKTIQAILAMRARIHSGQVQRVLIVCPKSLLPTWEREVNAWAPELSVSIVHGPNRKNALARKHHVYITNYETVVKEVCDDSRRQHSTLPDFDLLIVDELQNLKNLSTVRTKSVIGVRAKQRWGMTGTPMENSFDDYRTIWRVIDPDSVNRRLGQNEFVWWTRSNVLRREKRDVLKDLPSTMLQVTYVDLEGPQLSHYRHLESQSRQDAEEVVRKRDPKADFVLRGYVIDLIQKLKKQCVIDEESALSAKIDWLKDHLSTIEQDTRGQEKLLLFTQYPDLAINRWRLLDRLKQFHPMEYYGGTPLKDRMTFEERFAADDRCKLALVGIMAGGTGLTLTRANHLVFLDQWWNPSIMEQAAARIHRIGQSRTCTVTYLLARGTIEEKIYDVLKDKQQRSGKVIDQLVSTEELESTDFSDFNNALSVKELLGALGVNLPSI